MWTFRLVIAVLLCGSGVIQTDRESVAQFRAAVDLATVDFRAIASGQPVSDLRADEIELRVDGHPREVSQLEFLGRVGAIVPDILSGRDLPPGVWTNNLAESGQSFVIYFDDHHIGAGHEFLARDAAFRFLDRLTPYDRVALVTSAGVQVDLTTDHARARAALTAVTAHGRTPIELAGPKLAWLQTFLASLQAFDGPKSVILVSEGIPNRPLARQPPLTLFDYREVARAAFQARAQMYVIRPFGFEFDASQVGRTSGDWDFEPLALAASAAGGQSFEPAGRVDNIFLQIEREAASTYILGFSPRSEESDGKLHDVQLSCRRPGVTLLVRSKVLISKSVTSGRAWTALDLLKGGVIEREIALRAAAFTVEPPEKSRVKTAIVLEIPQDEAIPTDVAFAMISAATGKEQAVWTVPRNELKRGRISTGAFVPPGAYRIRAAVITPTRRGTVQFDFTTLGVSGGRLRLGDLMIGQGQNDGSFEPQLTFGPRTAATGYLVIGGNLSRGSTLSVRFELAQVADALAIVSVPGIVAATPSSSLWTARGAVPVGNLAAGDYLLRCRVTLDDVIVGEVRRRFRKE